MILFAIKKNPAYQYGVPINVFRLPNVLSNCALTPKSTKHSGNRNRNEEKTTEKTQTDVI